MSDSLNSTINRGSAIAQRTGRYVKVKADISDLKYNRNAAVQQLGNKLYPFVSNYPELIAIAGEEARTISDIDSRIAALETELTQIEEEVKAATHTQPTNSGATAPQFCPSCGASWEWKSPG